MGTPVIEAVVVNHNTSLFAEVAARSVLSAGRKAGAADIRLTVMDNASTDDSSALYQAGREVGFDVVASRWNVDDTTLNSHGDGLRDFVLAHPSCDYYLLVDADVCVTDDDVIPTMLEELRADDRLWAVQARYYWTERAFGPGSSLDTGAGTPQRVRMQVDDWRLREFTSSSNRRCQPAFALVRNTRAFRDTAAYVGLGCGLVLSHDDDIGGFHDTLGLASAVMRTHGTSYALSDAAVVHFWNVSYTSSTTKTREAERMLRALRRGETPDAGLFGPEGGLGPDAAVVGT